MDAQGIVAWIIIGLVAGLLANLVVGGSGNLFATLITGLIGSIVGGWLSGQMNWRLNLGNALVDQIAVSFIGAVLFLIVARFVLHL